MKALLISACFVLNYSIVFSQYSWLQKANFTPGNRSGAYSFSFLNMGYVGCGVNENGGNIFVINDLWAYDAFSNSWTQKASFPAPSRTSASTFVAGDFAYVCLGIDYTSGAYLNDLWQYNPSSNTWQQKSDFPGAARYTATSFGIGIYGYVGLGKSGPYHTDMYKYNSLTDIWSPVTAPVISSRQNAKGFSINGFGYLIGGANEITGINNYDFWQYDPVADSWTQKTSYPGQGSYSQIAFEMDNYGFVGAGAALPYSMNLTYSDFYRYDPSTDTWLAIADFGGGIRNSACFLSFGNRAFAGLGSTGVYPVLGYQVDWWEIVTATGINENKYSINQAVVYSAPGRIVKFEFVIPLKEKTYVNIFELNGKLVSKNIFEAGKMNFEISLQNSKSGIYSYEILNDAIKLQSGKLYCY